jgi:Carboxypeptidase regulatory-like domain
LVRNQAQPFLKVALPAGASILTAEVAGEKVKPVEGADGNRVPLLRTGFRPTGPYTVSFVFLHSGVPFARKGGSELDLPRMDVPIGLLQWEVFLPERYQVRDFGGDAIPASLVPAATEQAELEDLKETALGTEEAPAANAVSLGPLRPGQLGGVVTDPTGAVVAGAKVTVLHAQSGLTLKAVTDSNGRWFVSNVPAGRVRITVSSTGFKASSREADNDPDRPLRHDSTLQIGTITETVEVTASAVNLATSSAELSSRGERQARKAAAAEAAPSANVGNLQRRVAGVLPIAVDVPHAGSSYRFVRPLVLDEETKVTFSYRTK